MIILYPNQWHKGWMLITHIFSRLSRFTSLSLVWRQMICCQHVAMFTWCTGVALQRDGTHPLSFGASSTFVSPVTLRDSRQHTTLIQSTFSTWTESEPSVLMVWSDSPFLQLDLSLQPGLAGSGLEDPASITARKVSSAPFSCSTLSLSNLSFSAEALLLTGFPLHPLWILVWNSQCCRLNVNKWLMSLLPHREVWLTLSPLTPGGPATACKSAEKLRK